nr:reverse transcriptase [Tanacetum cinerariifolium]
MLADKDTANEACEMLRTMHIGADRVKEAKVQTLRSDFEEITVVNKFLQAVPIRFMQIVTSIEQFGDLKSMTVEEVVGHLKTYEERLQGYGDQQGEQSLLLTHAEWSARSKRTDERNSSNASKGREGSDSRGQGRGQGRERSRARANLLQTGEARVESNVWYLDNGTSNHMTGDCLKFHELDKYVSGRVKFGNSLMVAIMGKGSVLFDVKNGDQRLLNEVYFIPNLKSHSTCLLVTQDEPAWVWHTRLGHVNFHYLRRLAEKNMASGVPLICHLNKVCEGCVLAKQTRIPFPEQAVFQAKKPLELVHADLCDPITPTTVRGSGHLKKLDDRSKKMVYFEVEDGRKGNRLYDPQDGKLRPLTFEEAVTHKAWQEAMHAELGAIEINKTWKLTSLPLGHKSIGLKWVYKVKKDNMGNVVKYKARLVTKGYVQKQKVDYDEVFAPVARLDTIRVILALAAQHGWSVHHLDVKSAFLNRDLEEEVYVTQPEGSQDPAVYNKNSKGKTLIVEVYVDDLIIIGSYTEDIIEFKEKTKNEFEMSDLGLLAYYLRIKVSQKKWGIALPQTCYAKKILKQFGMQYCNPIKSPIKPKLKVDNDKGGEEIDSTEYRRLVGCLRYLTHTRPDLSFYGKTDNFALSSCETYSEIY